MSRTIWKHPFTGHADIVIEGYGLRVAHVGLDPASPLELPCVWVERREADPVDDYARDELGFEPPKMAFRFYGTGHPIPSSGEHVGSVITPSGLVWHVYGWQS